MNKFKSNWYLIYTRPRHEKKVYGQLGEMGISSFLPTKKVLRTWHDRRKFIDEPLFPSYLFIYLDSVTSYYDAIKAEGALSYVKLGKEPAIVREAVVNNLKLVVDRAAEIEVAANEFRPGERLVIKKGVFTGLECEMVKYNSKQKLLVRVDLLKRNLILAVPDEYLIPL